MLGRNHALSGAVGFLALSPVVVPQAPLSQVAVGTITCAAWALAPDIDHPGSTVSRSLGAPGRVASAGANLLTGGHRQGSHSLLASVLVAIGAWFVTFSLASPLTAAVIAGVGVLVAAPLMSKTLGLAGGAPIGILLGTYVGWLIWNETVLIDTWFFFAVAFGFTLHWMGDALTPQGVPLLWPVSKTRFKIPLFTTGSPLESVVSFIFIAALIILTWTTFSPAIPTFAEAWQWFRSLF